MKPSAWVEAVGEARFQELITDMCKLMRLKWHHETDSRKSKPGFPDLVIAGPGGVLFRELKKQSGRVTKDQREWLSTLTTAGADAAVWRPIDWESNRIYQELSALRSPQ